jgi:hypothetical protein
VNISDGVNTIQSPTYNFHTSMAWDINGDGNVGLSDVSLLKSNYGLTGLNGWIGADINNDGSVGLSDVSLLKSHYGEVYT